jgi:hypothetical protein
VTVQNTVTVTLTDVQWTGSSGSISSCSLTSISAGSGPITCTLTQEATLLDFEGSNMQITLAATATAPKDSTAIVAGVSLATPVGITLTPQKEIKWSFVRSGSTDAVQAVGESAQSRLCKLWARQQQL